MGFTTFSRLYLSLTQQNSPFLWAEFSSPLFDMLGVAFSLLHLVSTSFCLNGAPSCISKRSCLLLSFISHLAYQWGYKKKKPVFFRFIIFFGHPISYLITPGSDLLFVWFGLGGAWVREALYLWDSFWASSLDSLFLGISFYELLGALSSHFHVRTAFS